VIDSNLLEILLLLIFGACTAMSDFSYKDFATLCYPEALCPPALAGTLDCCASFASDIASQLVLNGGSHFQTCAHINSPTGDVVGLKGRNYVTGSDSELDPQIWTTQISKVSLRLRNQICGICSLHSAYRH
jgi:hypothetical protein